MDARHNPFVPGAGVQPPELAGRESLIEQVDIALDRTRNGNYANSIILLGLRGVGKTVLLNNLHGQAKSKGFETVKIEIPDTSGSNLARLMVLHLSVVLRRLDRIAAAEATLGLAAAALRNFASIFRIELGDMSFGVTPASIEAGSGDLEADLSELLRAVSEAAAMRNRFVAVFIDEVQYLTRAELSALARALHEAAQARFHFLFVGAGLPQIAALVGDAKSYAERLIVFSEVGPLSDSAGREALSEPAHRAGVAFTSEALDLIMTETQGFAYFLQAWGKFAWEEADASPIDRGAVERAGPAIRAHLDASFFRVRFDRCTQPEQRYLRAMAELGPGPHRTGDIATCFGTGSSQVAPIRKSLIDSGMIYSQRHGETAFTVPLFNDFMKRAIPVLTLHSPRRRTRK